MGLGNFVSNEFPENGRVDRSFRIHSHGGGFGGSSCSSVAEEAGHGVLLFGFAAFVNDFGPRLDKGGVDAAFEIICEVSDECCVDVGKGCVRKPLIRAFHMRVMVRIKTVFVHIDVFQKLWVGAESVK